MVQLHLSVTFIFKFQSITSLWDLSSLEQKQPKDIDDSFSKKDWKMLWINKGQKRKREKIVLLRGNNQTQQKRLQQKQREEEMINTSQEVIQQLSVRKDREESQKAVK